MNRISAQVVNIREPIVRRERREVRMSRLLPVSVRSVLRVVFGPNGLAQLAIFNAKAGRARARVVGGDEHATRRVHGHVAGARARRVARRKLLQLSGRQTKARHFPRRLAIERIQLRCRINEFARKRKPRHIRHFSRHADWRQRRARRIPVERQNPIRRVRRDKHSLSPRRTRCGASQ